MHLFKLNSDDTEMTRTELDIQQGEKDSSVLPIVHKKNRVTTWFELYRLQIFWTSLYTMVVLAIFAERAYCNSLFVINPN